MPTNLKITPQSELEAELDKVLDLMVLNRLSLEEAIKTKKSHIDIQLIKNEYEDLGTKLDLIFKKMEEQNNG